MSKLKSNPGDNSVVIIKPKAYYNMLVHVLRFGSKTKSRRTYKEVMGVLIGHLKDGPQTIKDLIIEEAVPISHGGSIEVSFAPEDYASFALVDEQYAEKNWFSVGWYHSHPNLGIFFSTTDVINQVGWQTPNPSAIGIVFDHTYLENQDDMGFRTFRLENPDKGASSNYYEVKTIVEPPDSLDYYFKLIELVKSVHTKEPPIKEINESPDLFSDIEDISKNQLLIEAVELDSKEILGSLKSSISKLIDISIEPVIHELNRWIVNFSKTQEVFSLNTSRDLIDLKQIVSNGLKETQKFLKINLKDKINGLEYDINDKFDVISDDLVHLKEQLQKYTESIKINLQNLTIDTINNPTNAITTEINLVFDDMNNILNAINSFSQEINFIIDKERKLQNQHIENQNKIEENFQSTLLVLTNEVDKALSNYNSKFLAQFGSLSKLKSEYLQVIEEIEKAKEKFTKEINDNRSEMKNLRTKIKKLESDNQALQKKIKKLEKMGE